MIPDNLFRRRLLRFADAQIEFDAFKLFVTSNTKQIEGSTHIAEIKKYCNFLIAPDFHRYTVQMQFGLRPLGRMTTEGKWAYEKGAALLYSLGPTGDVSTILYPCKSDVHNMFEDQIYICMERANAIRLRNKLKNDLRSLVSYYKISSLDADKSQLDAWRVRLLRSTRPKQMKGSFTPSILSNAVADISRLSARGIYSGFLKSVVIPAVVAALVTAAVQRGWITPPNWLVPLAQTNDSKNHKSLNPPSSAGRPAGGRSE